MLGVISCVAAVDPLELKALERALLLRHQILSNLLEHMRRSLPPPLLPIYGVMPGLVQHRGRSQPVCTRTVPRLGRGVFVARPLSYHGTLVLKRAEQKAQVFRLQRLIHSTGSNGPWAKVTRCLVPNRADQNTKKAQQHPEIQIAS